MTAKTPGFAAIPNVVAQSPDLHYGAKALFLAIASHASRDGVAWPSQATLAAETGMSEATVKRHLAALRDVGLLRWEVRVTDRGRQRFFRVWRPGDAEPALRVGSQDPGGRAPGDPMGGVTTGTEQEPANPEPAEQLPDADAPEGLFVVPDPVQEAPKRTARDLVALWVNWCRTTPQGEPDKAVMGQVAGQCGRIAKTRTDEASWNAAAEACRRAGLRRDPNVLRELAQVQPAYRGHRNYDLEALQAQAGAAAPSQLAQDAIAMIGRGR